MSTTPSAAASVKGAPAEDRDGTPLGTVEAVFLDDATGELGWLVVGGDAVVPAAGAREEGGRLRLAVDAALVASAPRLGGRGHLDPQHLEALRAHYAQDAGGRYGTAQHGTDRHETDRYGTGGYGAGQVSPSGNVAADVEGTPGAMTLAEERLTVSAERAPFARAVLRIETVTEEVMVPVTVTRQRARIEHLPLTQPTFADGGQDVPGVDVADGGQATPWVTLYGEEPVVEMRRVPVERVRLATNWVSTEEQVSAQLRHEEIALEDDTARR